MGTTALLTASIGNVDDVARDGGICELLEHGDTSWLSGWSALPTLFGAALPINRFAVAGESRRSRRNAMARRTHDLSHDAAKPMIDPAAL